MSTEALQPLSAKHCTLRTHVLTAILFPILVLPGPPKEGVLQIHYLHSVLFLRATPFQLSVGQLSHGAVQVPTRYFQTRTLSTNFGDLIELQ